MATLSPVDTPNSVKRVGCPAHAVLEVGVGDDACVAGFAFPVEGDSVTPARSDVTVDTVDGHVEFSADEPLGEGEFPFQGGDPGLRPRQPAGLLLPEGDGVLICLVVDTGLSVGGRSKLGGRREPPLLMQQCR